MPLLGIGAGSTPALGPNGRWWPVVFFSCIALC